MRAWLFLVVVVLMSVQGVVSAQETIVDNRLNLGISIEYSIDWVYERDVYYGELYLTNNEEIYRYLFLGSDSPLPNGTFYQLHVSPYAYFDLEVEDSVEALQAYLNVDGEWESTTINDRVAYQARYSAEHSDGLIIIYELSDGELTYSELHTAVGELTDEQISEFVMVVESIRPYNTDDVFDDALVLSQTAELGDFGLAFDYMDGWHLDYSIESQLATVSPAVISADDFWVGDFLIGVVSIPPQVFDVDEIPEEVTMDLLQTMAENVGADSGDGVALDVELLEIDGIVVGRVDSWIDVDPPGYQSYYLFILDRQPIIVFASANDEVSLSMFSDVVELMIPTIELTQSE